MNDLQFVYLALIILCISTIYLQFKIFDLKDKEFKAYLSDKFLASYIDEHRKRIEELESKVDYSLNK
jgi:hypothetical protein